MRGRLWRCAGDTERAGSGRAATGRAHAESGEAAQDPADPGALLAQATQGAGGEYGREIVDGFAGGGELPVPERGAPGAAGRGGALGREGLVAGEDGQEREQETQQGRRKMDAVHRLRQAVQGVGFGRSGDGV